MANPQTENGYIRIANEIWDEVIRRDFSKRQKDILFFIWRLSYGCRKKSAFIPKLVYFELCGIGNNHIKNELLFLEQSKVLFWDRDSKIFEVNKDYEQWQVTPVKGWKEFRFDEILSLNLEESSQNGKKKVPETGTKNFPKQEHLDDEENENFPKQELSTSQNGNISSEKVPKTGTSTPDEPLRDAVSQPPKDIFKDIIKNSSTSNLIELNQGLKQAAAAGDDFSFGRIYQAYEKNFTKDGKVRDFEAEELGVLYDDYGGEWLLHALRETCRQSQDKQHLAYVFGVLKGYRARGGPEEQKQVVGGASLYQVHDDDPITRMLREVNNQHVANGVT